MSTATTNNYENVKKYHGAIKIIALACERSRNWVRDVLQGKESDEVVIEVSKEVIKQLEAKKQKRLENALGKVPLLVK